MTGDPPSSGDGDEPIVGGTATEEGRTTTRGPVLAISVGVFALVAGGAFAVFALLGSSADPLQAIPGDVDMVVTVDLLQLTDSDRIDSLVATFAEPMEDAGYIESSDIDLAGQLEQSLTEEFGLSLEEDILPWVGGSLVIGAWIPSNIATADDLDAVLSVSIRDETAAAELIESVGEPVDASPFEDGTIYTPRDESVGPFVIWVGGDLLVMASDRTILREALEAREGGSVANDDDFAEAVSQLPAGRVAGFYAGPSFFQALADVAAAFPELNMDAGPTEDVRSVAVSLSLPDAGVQFDSVQLSAEGAAESPIAPSDGESLAALPADTLGYLGFFLAEGQVQEWLEQFRETEPEFFDQMAADAEAQLGVDLFGEVLPSIGGENIVAVLQSRDGMLAGESGLPLGILVSLGLTDISAITDLVASLEGLASGEGIEIRSGDPSVAVADGSEILAYEVTDDALVAGTSASVVEEFLEGAGGLTETALYQELNSELAGDELAFFVDMGRVFDLFDMTPEDRAIAEPIRGLGASYEVTDDGVIGSFLILIDYLNR